MAEAHLDHPGEIHWFADETPLPVIGPCTHDCEHWGRCVIAWGPSYERYELVECGLDGVDCGCRAWQDERGNATTAWLQVERGDADDGRCPRPLHPWNSRHTWDSDPATGAATECTMCGRAPVDRGETRNA